MTPSEAREQMVLLRFELAAGSWSPSLGECDAAAAALRALRLPDTTVAEALTSGTRAAASSAPWELSAEEGGSRLTRLMHDVAELLLSAEGGDAEERGVIRQNIVEVLAATGEHRTPATPSGLTGLFRRTLASATGRPDPHRAAPDAGTGARRGTATVSSYLIAFCGAVVLIAVLLLAGMTPVVAVPVGLVLLAVLQVAAWYVADPEHLRLMMPGARRRAARVRAVAYRQYATTVTEIVQSVLKHEEHGTRLEGDEYKELLEKLYAAPDVLGEHMNPYILASTNKMIPAVHDLLSSVARPTRATAQERNALVDAFEERLREFELHALTALNDITGDQASLDHQAAA
ncbi:hypothetical protein [Streptomyces sp. NPDC048638]|uniref:hypothetical protein n=1 Tax=Streptomyces sp. NPDC048638 TaxID=3365580 RepID=UPI0037171677